MRLSEAEAAAIITRNTRRPKAALLKPVTAEPVIIDELHERLRVVSQIDAPGRVTFAAVGLPKTKGSIRAFVPKGWTRAVLTSDTKGLKPWQKTISAAAITAMGTREPFTGALKIDVTFFLPRPKTGKRVYPIVRPDLDKLTRAAYDSLKGIVWDDDCQVTDSTERKRYGTNPGVVIVVEYQYAEATRR